MHARNGPVQAANENAEQDAVFALAAIVTRDGRLANLASASNEQPRVHARGSQIWSKR